jgi:hypothetical protein
MIPRMQPKTKLSKLVASMPFTRAHVAKHLSYSTGSFANVCNGFSPMPEAKRKKLAKLYGISLAVVRAACKETMR